MGEQASGQPPTPEQRAAFARKLEELEALGVPTDGLKRVIEERPQDFEREAEAAMRAELMGGQPEDTQATSDPIRISGAALPSAEPVPGEQAETPEHQPDARLEQVAVAPPAQEVPAPVEGPPPAEPTAELPPNEVPVESIEELEAKLAAYVAATPAEPAVAPTPAVLEEEKGAAADLAADVSLAVDEALAEAPPPPSDEAPPLADGDMLSLGAAQAAPRPPRPPREPGAKPPPPTGRAPPPAPAAPVKRVVVRSPAGAKPVAAAAAATEVLPAQQAPRRSFGKAAAGIAVVIVVLAATYMLLVNTAPVAAFSFSPFAPVAGEPVLFTANATNDPNGDPVSYRWQFGDGSPNASGPVVTHTFAKSGNYSVSLTATDDHKNAQSVDHNVPVEAGVVAPPVYRYGDRLDYTVSGRSHVSGAFAPLAKVNFTFTGFSGSCDIDAVDLNYEGPQARAVLPDPAVALDGFLDAHNTYVVERSLSGLQLIGQVNVSNCPPSSVAFTGTSDLLERSFQNLDNNDTVRSDSTEDLSVHVETNPPKDFDSTASMTDFPELSSAAEQLHFESVYAGRTFSTEGVSSGNFTADGQRWLWITQGAVVIAGALAIKIHFTLEGLPTISLYELTADLWVSSVSSFPLREFYHVRGADQGRNYDSSFDATAAASPVTGTSAIPFQSLPRAYRTVNGTDLAPLSQVPRATAGADLAFTPRTALDEALVQPQCTDLATFMVASPNAYAVNGTYSRSTGNPKWTIDFSQDPSGESQRLEDEHSTSTQIRCPTGAESANHTRQSIGQVVSLNYAADLMKREQTAAALFPAGAFDSLHANFTVRQQLRLPSLSLNAALTASRAAVPYAFGAESVPSEGTRTSAYVDATTGQLIYALVDTGDRLP